MASLTAVDIQFVDGTSLSFTTTTYACLADRVAFERRYKMGFREFQKTVTEEMATEEQALFLTWRVANRHQDQDAFDEWIEKVADFDLSQPGAEQNGKAPDPTLEAVTP